MPVYSEYCLAGPVEPSSQSPSVSEAIVVCRCDHILLQADSVSPATVWHEQWVEGILSARLPAANATQTDRHIPRPPWGVTDE